MAAAGSAGDPVHPEPDVAALPAANGHGLPEIAAADAHARAAPGGDPARRLPARPRTDPPRGRDPLRRADRPLLRRARAPRHGRAARRRLLRAVRARSAFRAPSATGSGSRTAAASSRSTRRCSPSRCSSTSSSAGLPALVEGYLGEPPLITAQKTTLRKADPSVSGAWHQDGKFMGPVRALNLWLSLSRCGDESPGLDLVPRRFDEFVTTGTDEAAWFFNMVSQNQAELAAAEIGDHPADLRARRRAVLRRAVPAQDRIGPVDAEPAVRDRELVLRRFGVPGRLRADRRLSPRRGSAAVETPGGPGQRAW